jgi:hypothetical protein
MEQENSVPTVKPHMQNDTKKEIQKFQTDRTCRLY